MMLPNGRISSLNNGREGTTMRQAIDIRVLAFATAVVFGMSAHVHGQDRETLAKHPNLFLEMATKLFGWNAPAEPMKIVGRISFVGTKGLGVWLISTSEGHILLNTGMPSSGPMIEASIRTLGLKPEDVRLLLTGHAHIDHVGGHAYLKKLSGTQVAMMDAEADVLRTGGTLDFFYGKDVEAMGYEPVKVDRVFRDGDTIKLGDVALTARLTPGHTKGATTFIMNVVEGGKDLYCRLPRRKRCQSGLPGGKGSVVSGNRRRLPPDVVCSRNAQAGHLACAAPRNLRLRGQTRSCRHGRCQGLGRSGRIQAIRCRPTREIRS